MELISIITVLSIGLSVLLTPCDSRQITQLHPSLYKASDAQLSVTILPRKLRILTKKLTVEEHGGKNHSPYYKQKVDFSGKSHQTVHVKGGTWQEWVEEGTDTSDFFTMDYSRVKRRRPIHNKSLPVGP